MLCSLIVLSFALFSEAAAPTATSAVYSKRKVLVNDQSVDAFTFVITFDTSTLFVPVVNVSIAGAGGYTSSQTGRFSYSYSASATEVTGIHQPTHAEWYALSQVLFWSKSNRFVFQCNNQKHFGSDTSVAPSLPSAPEFTARPPPMLVYGESNDALVSAMAAYYNVPELHVETVSSKNKLMITILSSASSYANITDIDQALSGNNCRLELRDIKNQAGETQPIIISQFTRNTLQCDNALLKRRLEQLDSLVDGIDKQSNVAARAKNAVLAIQASDSVAGCEEFLQSSTQTTGITVNSTESSCDAATGLNTCCPPVRRTLTRQVFSGFNAAEWTRCRVNRVPEVAAAAEAMVDLDFNAGACERDLFNKLGVSDVAEVEPLLFERGLGVLDQCIALIYPDQQGNARSCTSNGDCYTRCLIRYGDAVGRCAPPVGIDKGAMAQCLIERADKALLALFTRQWGYMFSITKADRLGVLLGNNAQSPGCVGRNALKSNGGWFKPNPTHTWISGASTVVGNYAKPTPTVSQGVVSYPVEAYGLIGTAYEACTSGSTDGCFYLPPNQAACNSGESCSWDFEPIQNRNCSAGSSQFCGECYGNECVDRTRKSLCVYNLNNMSDCSMGTIYSDLATANSTKLCVSGDFDATSCNSECKVKLKPVITRSMCLVQNWASGQPCSGQFYKQSFFDTRDQIRVEICVLNVTESACLVYNGGVSVTWANFPLPQSHLQLFEAEEQLFCQDNYCFNSGLPPQACLSQNYYWNWNLNNGTGMCTRVINRSLSGSQYKQTCEQTGGGWESYIGRYFRKGLFENEATCVSSSFCESNPYASSCTVNCNRKCDKCVGPNIFQDGVCFHSDSNVCNSHILSGLDASWNSTSQTCVYVGGRARRTCESVTGHTTDLCSARTTSSSCTSGSLQSFTKCEWKKSNCASLEECAQQGVCMDSFELSASGTCVKNFTIDARGLPTCPQGTKRIKMGCADSTISSSGTCTTAGGRWTLPAVNKAECEARKGCCEPDKFDCSVFLSSKSQTDCEACGGTMQQIYGFVSGKASDPNSLEWRNRAVVPTNIWSTLRLDVEKLRQAFISAVSSHVKELAAAYITCKSSKLRLLESIACQCGVNADIGCGSAYGETVSDVGVSVACGEQKKIFVQGASVTLDYSGLNFCSTPANISLGLQLTQSLDGQTNVTQPRFPSAGGIKKRSTITSFSASSACFTRVKNWTGSYVGQIRGDCLKLGSNVAFSGVVQVCLPFKSSISYDPQMYPNIGVATASFDDSSNAIYSVSSEGEVGDVTSDSKRVCFRALTSGTYCPAAYRNNYLNAEGIPQPACTLGMDVYTPVNTAARGFVGSATSGVFGTTVPRSIQVGSILDSFTFTAAGSTVPFVTLQFARSQGNGLFRIFGTSRVRAVGGVATFNDIVAAAPGAYRVGATVEGLGFYQLQQYTVTANPGLGAGVVFTVQPVNTPKGSAMGVNPVLKVVDFFGNELQSTQVAFNLTAFLLYPNAQEVLLTSTLVQPQTAQATYVNLQIPATTPPQTGFRLKITCPFFSTRLSEPFDVVEPIGAAIKLAFESAISTSSFNAPISPAIVVRALDSVDAVVTTYTGLVSLSLYNASRPNANLQGTVSKVMIGGVVSFDDVTVDRPGAFYGIAASSLRLSSALTGNFANNGPSGFSIVLQPPASVTAGTAFSVIVQMLDIFNAPYADSSDTVNIALRPPNSNTPIRGITSGLLEDGIFVFNVIIDRVGTGYELRIVAESSGVAGITRSFAVAAPPPPASTASRSRSSSGGPVETETGETGEFARGKRSDVNTQLVGTIIGALLIGLATIIVMMSKLTNQPAQRRRKRKRAALKAPEKSSVVEKTSSTSSSSQSPKSPTMEKLVDAKTASLTDD